MKHLLAAVMIVLAMVVVASGAASNNCTRPSLEQLAQDLVACVHSR